jgi:carbon-monoxide dehydrogenase small subunit
MTQFIEIVLQVNGRSFPARVEPRTTLADAVRDACGQTGTHVGCEHGVCGACTVLVEGEPVRGCLMLAVQAAGKPVRTVEGLAIDGKLSDLQEAFMSTFAIQCGYCTPGFLMLASGLLEAKPDATREEIADVLSSNICRCTGYTSIVDAVVKVAAARKEAR